MAARSKAWVCDRTLAGTVGSNPAGAMDVSLVTVVCYQVEVSGSGRSLIHRNPTECGVRVCVYEREASTMRPTRVVERLGRGRQSRILQYRFSELITLLTLILAR